MNIAGTLNYDTKVDTQGIEQGVNKVSKTAKSGGDIVKIAVGNMIADLAKVAVEGLKEITSAGINYNAQMETYQTSFKVMLGSAEEANKFLAQLKDKASKTPFELTDLAKASQTLLAFGVDAQDTQKYLDMLGDVSQGNAEKLGSLTLAFGQVQSSGKLTGQDLLQFINVGFNPLNEIAKKTGESMVDLKDRMSQGGVSAQEVADAFESATSEGGLFYGSMNEQSKTFNGQLSTLKDNVSTFLGEAMKPLFDYIKSTILPALNEFVGNDDIIDKIKEITKFIGLLTAEFLIFKAAFTIQKIIKGFQEAQLALSLFSLQMGKTSIAQAALNGTLKISETVVGLLTGKIKLMELAQLALNAVMSANPIALLIIAIGSLIAIFVYLWNTNESFREFFINLWQGIVDFFVNAWNGIVDFFKTLPETFSNIIQGIIDFFKKIPEYIGFMIGFIIGLFVKFVEFMWNFYTVTIPSIINGIIDWFKELPKNILNFFSNIISGIATWVVDMVRTVREKFPEIINKIVNFFAELPGKMIDIGKNIITGIWDGIKSSVNWLGDKIKEFAGGIVSGFKKALGIHSPSKIFKKEAKWIPVGVGVGIEENTDEALKGIDKLSDSMVDRMQQAVSLEAGKVSFSGTNGTVSQILTANGTTTVNVNSKLELDGDTVYENQKVVEAKKNLQTQFS